MSLFLNTIANDVAGTVCFSLPVIGDDGRLKEYVNIEAFLSEDPQISMKNNWEAIIPDVGALNDFTQLISGNQTSWLSSSKASWKGTDPITITLNFYLITFRMAQINGSSSNRPCDIPVSEQASYFAQLLAVSPQQNGAGSFSDWGIGVHGGYKPNVWMENSNFAGNGQTTETQNEASANTDAMLGRWESIDLNDGDGTIQIVINGGGNRTAMFTKMLLADATFTPSTVRTGYWTKNGDNQVFVTSPEPLYIKVTATFRLMHSATVADAKRMFTGRA